MGTVPTSNIQASLASCVAKGRFCQIPAKKAEARRPISLRK